ncbi:MAG: hypothetical protein ACD_80C00174G0008 [uncultured bacterium (gcode 4)]|uniref:Uncharacterized protein n=1 Tax=uncultured bacterium (gcode 4) TaxID=1234023 RepID=K1XW89_9BACT|nr:MAG: hypothetical protein ACD_80C00174G0008 [uncultured bacterium (gcode 4)]HBB03875.1 hypothetical protein [Candidatus Gracilibacteria bacterium]
MTFRETSVKSVAVNKNYKIIKIKTNTYTYMKKIFIAIVLIISIDGCKKDTLQPNWWNKLWHKEMYVMGDLNDKHKNSILPKIDEIRTTLQQYVLWDSDTIQIYGPGGYRKTAEKAWKVWNKNYQTTLMPDTLNPSTTGEFAKIIKSYLDLRRDYDREKAFKKMWLCIPKELYKQDERFWEWWLSSVSTYCTVVLGGPEAWTYGTRQRDEEMKIYHLPTTPDPDDPWGCECSAETRITEWYEGCAEGPKKKMIALPDFEQKMQGVRAQHAKSLRDRYLNVADPNFQIGPIEDYEVKSIVVEGEMYYGIGIPNIPTRY